jgi:hypothetical protein
MMSEGNGAFGGMRIGRRTEVAHPGQIHWIFYSELFESSLHLLVVLFRLYLGTASGFMRSLFRFIINLDTRILSGKPYANSTGRTTIKKEKHPWHS